MVGPYDKLTNNKNNAIGDSNWESREKGDDWLPLG